MKDNIGLYYHIPFCRGKCPYCAFYSMNLSTTENIVSEYIEKLLEYAQSYASKYKLKADTLYIGGGTPSLLQTSDIVRLVLKTRDIFFIDDKSEITLEINPADAVKLDFVKLRSCGVNRLSIGMQSANSSELKLLGRRHKSEDVKFCVSKAQSSGFDNISLDLILAIPQQNKESLLQSIEFCNDLNVQHISAYMLTIENGTNFDKRKNTLGLLNDDSQADLYLFAVENLESCGFGQYEISSFAKKGFQGIHNLKYWNSDEYLGIGPSAHSYFAGKRFFYPTNIDVFFEKNNVRYEKNYDISKQEEFAMLKLRLKKGLIFTEFEKYFNCDFPKKWLENSQKFTQHGLLKISKDSINLTTKGFIVSNAIISEIIL